MQAAIDRDEISELAFEGSMVPQVVPYSTFPGLQAYQKQQQPIIDKYDPGANSPELVAQHMTAAGYAKDADGFWAKGGERLSMDMDVMSWLPHVMPVSLTIKSYPGLKSRRRRPSDSSTSY